MVVADFVNRGKDPAFDPTLRRAVEIELGQSPYLSILPQPKVAETLRMMGRPADERLSEPVAREVCQRNSGQAVIAGEIVSVGSHYLVTLDALDCATGSAISRAKAEAASKEDVLKSLDRVTGQVRRQLGESPRSIQQFDVPIYQATTKSFDALVAFSKGNAMTGVVQCRRRDSAIRPRHRARSEVRAGLCRPRPGAGQPAGAQAGRGRLCESVCAKRRGE
jgi:hypothetical protein